MKYTFLGLPRVGEKLSEAETRFEAEADSSWNNSELRYFFLSLSFVMSVCLYVCVSISHLQSPTVVINLCTFY
jgi:hypothetical protein